jgi:hypothetical protein
MTDMLQITFQQHLELEYYEMNVYMLEKERQKITRRGALSPSEDARLNAIDAELEHWFGLIEQIDPQWIDDEV